MLAGELYDPLDPDLAAARDRARDLCADLNATREAQQGERRRILQALLGAGGDDVWMQPPFFCDYGANIELGERVVHVAQLVEILRVDVEKAPNVKLKRILLTTILGT